MAQHLIFGDEIQMPGLSNRLGVSDFISFLLAGP